MVNGAVIVCLFTTCDRGAGVPPEPTAHNKKKMGDGEERSQRGKIITDPCQLRKRGTDKQRGQRGC